MATFRETTTKFTCPSVSSLFWVGHLILDPVLVLWMIDPGSGFQIVAIFMKTIVLNILARLCLKAKMQKEGLIDLVP